MDGLNQIEYVVGIGQRDDLSKDPQKFLSSILYLEDQNNTPLCGIKAEDVGDSGVYVANIGQYLVNIDASNRKLGQLMDGLTVKKVITDYLKYFVQLALKRLQVHDKLIKNKHFQEFVNAEFIDEDIKSVCYCLVCPTDRQEFMKDCFVKAGIIEKSEAEHRLSFVIKAVAVAHYQLSLDRNTTEIQNDEDYFVIDVDDISIGISKIHAASTESFSTVTKIFDDTAQGLINVAIKFEDYLINNMTELNMNIWLINKFVQTFSKNIKHGYDKDTQTRTAIPQVDFDGNPIKFSYEDLNQIVFEPFFEIVDEFVSKADETHDQCKMFLSGNYTANAYLVKNFIAKENKRLKYCYSIVKNSLVSVSSGAVSSRLNTYKSQTPFSVNGDRLPLFSDKKWSLPETVLGTSTDYTAGNEAYDFIVGIDFGSSFSGCSYIQLKNKNGIPVDATIETINEGWPGANSYQFGRTPTLLMYDEKMKPKYWGEEAWPRGQLHKDINLLQNFKLLLCPESLENFFGHTNDLEEPKGQEGFADDGTPKNDLDAIRVTTDYLKLLKNHIIEYIVTKGMKEKFNVFTRARLLKKYKIRYVITVPAMWNSSSRNTMAQAAIEAGIILKDEIDQLLIINEPEAAASFCEKRLYQYFQRPKRGINNTNFIVCDAGGGTVELLTFNVQLNKKGNTSDTETIICQIGDGIGDTCGSTCLDIRFKNYLFEFYKSFGVNIDKENVSLDNVIRDFVSNIKPDFMPDLQDSPYCDIKLPGKGIVNYTMSSNYRLADGNKTLKIKNQEMKKKIFDPVVDRILALIDNQIKQAANVDSKIDAILMVGGFSQSEYLQLRIKDRKSSDYPLA
ncbi:hypothetical protein INT47_011036 [Mucor saturninus]|uniref:Hsp70 family protein n=1 Tax=Mucor saturninus TaxID=64648 RepID=A0A8H7V3K4_9FUNG|nr:hypothetical protein INT47_011036 [Mucor saturninus]